MRCELLGKAAARAVHVILGAGDALLLLGYPLSDEVGADRRPVCGEVVGISTGC
jgi:hypothetical protein